MTALLTLTLVMLAPVPTPAPLKWKLAKGDTFYSKTVLSMNQTITIKGQDVEQEQEQSTFQKFKVLSADAKGYKIEQTIQKSEVKSNLPGAEETAKKMEGIVLTFTLDADFTVSKVEGLHDLLDKVSGDNAEVRKLIAGILTEEMFSAGFAETFRTAPDKPVRVNDKWNRKYKLPMGGGLGALKVDTAYKYTKAEEGADTVTWTAKTEYEAAKEDGALPFKITAGELTAEELSGEYVFDSKLGRLKSHSSKAKINGMLTISANGMDTEMRLKQVIKTTSTISDKSLVKD